MSQSRSAVVGSSTLEFIADEPALVAAALALGADTVGQLSDEEVTLARIAPKPPPPNVLRELSESIGDGGDPLGDIFCQLRLPDARRPDGAVYTPSRITEAMVEWAAVEGSPTRVVDPGAGSGRFALAAARRFRHAEIVANELDPLAALLLRANLAVSGNAARSQVVAGDYRSLELPQTNGETLFVGNPPYVRHHLIEPRWKQWLSSTARDLGLVASQLAGLHVHFFLATATLGRARDYGAFITSAEWLDVNYGALVRALLLGPPGGQAIHILEPTTLAFEETATTAAIACFRLHSKPNAIRLRRVKTVGQLNRLAGGWVIERERLAVEPRWTALTRPRSKIPEGHVELGDICRVHRGSVTGSNNVWVAPLGARIDIPDDMLFPSVTRARELFAAVTVLDRHDHLRSVIDIPADLDEIEASDRKRVERFLRTAKGRGAALGYIARHRKAWWSVGLREPAPILATYMARRPPAFVRNETGARHLNIAHGIYPRQPLPERAVRRLSDALRATSSTEHGRTYAGGLTKLEPKEMERIAVPSLELLLA